MSAAEAPLGTTAPATGARLLDVRNLSVGYRTADGRDVTLVDDVSFELDRGEALGLAGESGCGKTTTALALMGLLPRGLRRTGGTIELASSRGIVHIDRRTERGMQQVRWRDISIVFQGAMNALDPVMRISRQMTEAIRLHEPELSSSQVKGRIAELLGYVGINPSRADQYPHEFSGGMRQRVMIALSLACKPDLVIGDEPTTALDVMMQAQILELLENMRRDLGIAMILITHDLSVLAETCDRVAIMYAGRIVERGPVDRLYATPHHPYTRRLLSAFPAIGGDRTLAPPIPGGPPDPLDPVEGCPFHPRCHMAREECRDSRPEHREVADGLSAACHFAPWPPGALDEPDAMFGREARR